jgi:hypothetical protein
MTEIMIDPNVHVSGGLTFSGLEDVRGPMPAVGHEVLVREPEANLVAVGVVRQIDRNDRLIFIEVDWAQLAPDRVPTPDEFVGMLQLSEQESPVPLLDRLGERGLAIVR